MQFVILEHEVGLKSHFDLMFEQPGGMLATWSLPSLPGAGWLLGTRLPDHRARYLRVNGPLAIFPGWVRRREHGTYAPLFRGLDQGMFRIVTRGQRRGGLMEWEQVDGGTWRCRFQLATGA